MPLGSGRRSRLKPRLTALAAAVVLLAVLNCCAGSGYTYVTSTSTGTYFKVPDGWKVYKQGQVAAHFGVSGSASGSQAQLPFLVVFDADPKPSLDHDLPASPYPFGLARVRSLSGDEQDTYSLASLRNEVFNIDQLAQSDPNAVRDLAAPKALVHQGMRGTHLEYTAHAPDGTNFSIDQVAYIDAATHKVWILVLGCAAACYAQHKAAIHRVADSWTVEGK